MNDWATQLRAAQNRPSAPTSDFDLNAPAVRLIDITRMQTRRPRPAAILAAISEDTAGPRLWLTQRSAHLRHHPGQIAFPGGKIENTDKDPAHAALREAHEEMGLPPSQCDVIAVLPCHQTTTGFEVTPVIAQIHGAFHPQAQPGEVNEVFSVPLFHVLDCDNFMIETRAWQGQPRRYYTVPYGPYYIWGATARILRSIAQMMQ